MYLITILEEMCRKDKISKLYYFFKVVGLGGLYLFSVACEAVDEIFARKILPETFQSGWGYALKASNEMLNKT